MTLYVGCNYWFLTIGFHMSQKICISLINSVFGILLQQPNLILWVLLSYVQLCEDIKTFLIKFIKYEGVMFNLEYYLIRFIITEYTPLVMSKSMDPGRFNWDGGLEFILLYIHTVRNNVVIHSLIAPCFSYPNELHSLKISQTKFFIY